jgi:hypothetical protein
MIKMKSTVKFTVLFLPFAPSIRMAEKELCHSYAQKFKNLCFAMDYPKVAI